VRVFWAHICNFCDPIFYFCTNCAEIYSLALRAFVVMPRGKVLFVCFRWGAERITAAELLIFKSFGVISPCPFQFPSKSPYPYCVKRFILRNAPITISAPYFYGFFGISSRVFCVSVQYCSISFSYSMRGDYVFRIERF